MTSKRKNIVKRTVMITAATMIAGIGEDGESVQVNPGDEHKLRDHTAELLVKIKKGCFKFTFKDNAETTVETEEYKTAKAAVAKEAKAAKKPA